jgi:hypothetical protein
MYNLGIPSQLKAWIKYLRAVFASIGIGDIEIICAEGLALSPAHREPALNAAHATIPTTVAAARPRHAAGRIPRRKPLRRYLMPDRIHELLRRRDRRSAEARNLFGDFCSPSDNGHSRYGHRTARFAPNRSSDWMRPSIAR